MTVVRRAQLVGVAIAAVLLALVAAIDAHAQASTVPDSAAPITSEHAGSWLWQGFEDVGVPLVLAAGVVAVFALFRRATEA